jgi:hypothetical protein
MTTYSNFSGTGRSSITFSKGTDQIGLRTNAGRFEIQHNGESWDEPMLMEIARTEKEPTGFPNRTDSTVTYSIVNRQFTIAPTGASFMVWRSGKRYTYTTSQTPAAHADVTGVYFFYINSAGTFTVANSVWDLSTDVPIAYVLYNTDLNGGGTNDAILCEERHGLTMDYESHIEFHYNIGAYIRSGCAASGYVLNSAANADIGFALDTGDFADEDIVLTIPAKAEGTYTVLYRLNANGDWNWYTGQAFPFHYAGGGLGNIEYNQFTAGAWQLTQVTTTNRWMNMFVCATNSTDANFQVVCIPGQAIYTTLAAAQAESILGLNWGSLPFQEIAPLYQITYRYNTTYGSTGKVRIERFARVIGTKLTSATLLASAHNSLSGRDVANCHPADAIGYDNVTSGLVADDVQAAIDETLNKIFTGAISITTSAGGANAILGATGTFDFSNDVETQAQIRVDTGSLLIQSVKCWDKASDFSATIKPSTAMTVDTVLTLPTGNPTAGQLLYSIDAAGTLGWTTAGATIFEESSNLIREKSAYGYDNSFVIGSSQMNDEGSGNQDKRMFYDRTTGSFRAGEVAGTQWDTRGTDSVALGYNTTASANYSVAIGNANTASGVSSVCVGGSSNTASQSHSAIFGGNGNSLGNASSTYSGMFSAYQCIIGSASYYSSASAIAGGSSNTIAQNASGGACFMGGGQSNTIDAPRSAIIGGYICKVYQNSGNTEDVILGGESNTIGSASYQAAQSVIVGGQQNIIGNAGTADRSVILGGEYNEINHYNSVAMGRYTKTHWYGARVHASGRFGSVSGSAQNEIIQLMATTTAASWTLMYPANSSSYPLNLTDKHVYGFIIMLVGAVNSSEGSAEDVPGDSIIFKFEGAIKRVGATTTLLTQGKTILYADSNITDCDARVTADDTNERLQVEVYMSDATSRMDWTATVMLTVLGYQ